MKKPDEICENGSLRGRPYISPDMISMQQGDGRVMVRNHPITISLVILTLLFGMPTTGSDAERSQEKEEDLPLLWTHWGRMDIDSLEEGIPDFNHEGDTSYWIVQFGGPITVEMRKRITDMGMKIVDYFPDFAYVVNVGELNPEELGDIKGVVGTSPFLTGMKIAPRFRSYLEGKPGHPIVVELFEPVPGIESGIGETSAIVEIVSETRFMTVPFEEDPFGISGVDGVKWVEPKMDMVLFNDVAEGIMDVDYAKENLSLDGTGQTVAVTDSGLDTGVDNHSVDGDIHLDFDNRVTFSNWAGSSPDDYNGHGTHVAGSVAGDGTRSGGNIQGMATNASIFFQGIETDGGYLSTPSNLSLLFRESYQNGARIHTNSWGSGSSSLWGVYTTSSYDVDWSMHNQEEMLILFSAGNDGNDRSPTDGKIDPDSISPPATSKSTLTVGASENDRPSSGLNSIWYYFGPSDFSTNPIRNDHISDDENGIAAFSSRGPTNDGRIKPEVVAPGTNILSTKSSLSGSGWASYDSYYYYLGGTSMATPLTAGTAVLVREYLNKTLSVQDPSGALIKSIMINGARDLTPGQYGTNPTTQEVNSRPDNDQGFGRVNFRDSVEPEGGRMDFLDHKEGLSTGENVTRVFRVNGNEELRLALAWTDYPGPLSSGKQLINDLDLILTAPNGSVYHGNDLTEPRNDSSDRTNIVETVTILNPTNGWWRVEVEGYNVPMDTQPFALLMSGNATNLINDTISMDRGFYSTSGDTITITLTSMTVAGEGSVDVFINSTSEPTGKNVTLTETADEGTFKGEVMTVNFSGSGPDEIFVRHMDNITVRYYNIYCGECIYRSRAANPAVVKIIPKPENWLTYSKWDWIVLDGSGDPGLETHWKIDNSSMEWIKLHDDGGGGDLNASDGLYHSEYIVDSDMIATGDILLKIKDPYLGDRVYPQFPLSINTSLPQAPGTPRASPLQMGNALNLRWGRVTFHEIANYTVYVNVTPPVLSPQEDHWKFLQSVNGRRNHTTIYDLTDGVTYFFRVSATNEYGNESSSSLWGNGTPADSLHPGVDILNEPDVLTGEITLRFESDPDTEMIQVQYYRDSDGNGEADDGNEFVNATSGEPESFNWNTTLGAGGPGDAEHMILRYRGMDEVPNISPWTEKAGFSVDNTGPSGIMVEPIPQLTRISRITVSGSTEPNSRILFNVNGEHRGDYYLGPVGSFERNLDLDEGNNTVELLAFDENGAGPTKKSLFITLDTMKPEISAVANSTTVEIGTERIRVDVSATDRGLDPRYTEIDNITWEMETPEEETRIGYDGGEVVFDPMNTGDHILTITARDLAGNVNSSEIRITVVDTTEPRVNISGPGYVIEDTRVTYSPLGSEDNHRGLLENDGTRFLWNITHENGWNRISRQKLLQVKLLDPGIYTLKFSITDPGGNTGNASRTIRVRDITPPVGSIEGNRYLDEGDSAVYTANVSDNDPRFPAGSTYKWTVYIEYGSGLKEIHSQTGESLNYTFTDPDNYTVELFVTDGSGNGETLSTRVYVDRLPSSPPKENENGWLIAAIIIVTGIVLILAIVLVAVKLGIGRNEITEVEWEEDDWEDGEEDWEW